MKKLLSLALAMLCLALLLTGCAQARTLTGKAMGYGGELTVSVAMEGEKISAVTVTRHGETPSFAAEALQIIPAAIVAKNATDVDVVAGATVTSRAIIAAVNNATDPEAHPFGGR